MTCENHQITGALGSAIAELIAEKTLGRRLARISVDANLFGEVGTLDWLAECFHLSARHIAEAARRLISHQ